jgi:hypothetical protein
MKESEKIMTQVAVIHSAFEDVPNTVAFVEVGNVDVLGVTEALEYAFHKTNNIAGSWSREAQFEFDGQIVDNPDFSEDVTVMAELPVSKRTGEVMGLRSTSMGDMMLLGTKKYKVAAFGFEEIV